MSIISSSIDHLKRLPGWWLVSAVALAAIVYLAPQQLGVLLFKGLQVTISFIIGFLADKALYANVPTPDDAPHDNYGAARILARAAIVCGTLIAFCIGL